jgi:hypothetical protein
MYSYSSVFDHVPDSIRNADRIDVAVYLFYIFQMKWHSICTASMLMLSVLTILSKCCCITLSRSVSSICPFRCALSPLVRSSSLFTMPPIMFECAKLCSYNQHETRANVVFAVWVVVWVLTRLIYFPMFVVRGGVWESVARLGFFPLYSFNAITLLILLALHVFWTTMIVRMIVRMITGDAKQLRDTRELDMPTEKKSEQICLFDSYHF